MGGVFKQLAENKSPAAHISEHRKRLHKLCEEVKASAPNVAPQGQGNSSHVPDPLRDKLMLLADEVLAASEKFELKLVKYEIKAQKPKSKPKIWKEAFKYSVFEKKKIDDLHESMRNYENTMQTSVLVDLQKRVGKLDKEIIKRLDDKTQHFALQLNAGFSKLEDVIQIESKSIQTLLAAQLAHTDQTVVENSKATQKDISASERNIKDHVDVSFEQLRENDSVQLVTARVQRLLDSLDFTLRNARYNDIKISHEDTLDWIFDPDSYRVMDTTAANFDRGALSNWMGTTENLFWISGKPGSGKSTLMKFLSDHSCSQQQLKNSNAEVIVISAFLWNAGPMEQRGLKFVASTLLHQLLTKRTDIARAMLGKYSDLYLKRSLSDWSQESLQAALTEGFHLARCTIRCFIDGLDEIDNADGNGLFELLQFIDNLCGIPGMKICVSSRPEPMIIERCESYPHWRLQDLTHQDLENYTTKMLAPHWEKARIQDNRTRSLSKLVAKILSKADGVFLWVYLVVSSIRNGIIRYDDWDMLVERIEELPSQLNGLYNNMWRRLNQDTELHRSQAALYFRLVISRNVALLLDDFGEPVWEQTILYLLVASNKSLQKFYLEGGAGQELFDIGEQCDAFAKQVVNRCGGFIEARPTDKNCIFQEVHFIHKSAIDFLQKTTAGQNILLQCDVSDQEILIRLGCSLLVVAVFFATRPSLLIDFADSMHDWIVHRTNFNDPLKHAVLRLAKASFDRMPWWKNLGYDFDYYAVSSGNMTYMKSQLLEASPKGDIQMTQWKSFLLAHACEPALRGYTSAQADMIRWLLEQGADPNLPVSGPRLVGKNPFHCFLNTLYERLSETMIMERDSAEAILGQFLAHGANIGTSVFAQIAIPGSDSVLDNSALPEYFLVGKNRARDGFRSLSTTAIIEIRNASFALMREKSEVADCNLDRQNILVRLIVHTQRDGKINAKPIDSLKDSNLIIQALKAPMTDPVQKLREFYEGLSTPPMDAKTILNWVGEHCGIDLSFTEGCDENDVLNRFPWELYQGVSWQPLDLKYRPEYSKMVAEMANIPRRMRES